MSETNQPAGWGFTEGTFPESAHMCLIYNDEEQRRRVVAAFLRVGLDRGELVRYVTDEAGPEDARAWLASIGVATPTDRPEALGVFQADGFYMKEGRFDPRRLVAEMPQRYQAVAEAGYAGVRSCGEMSWALRSPRGTELLLEYESLLNGVTTHVPHRGVCQYDARRFDGATLFRVLQVHPYMVAQGQVVRNPFYVTPQEFSPVMRSPAETRTA